MSSLSSVHFKKIKQSALGFGLIELMVSISIMLLVAAIVMAKQDSFNGAVLLRSEAYEIALSAREIQLNSVSAISIAGNYRTLLGLHFDTNNDALVRIFRDGSGTGANGFYNSGEEFGKQMSLDSRFEVRGIYTVNGGTRTSVSNLSVVFERPNFDARFFQVGSSELLVPSIEVDISKRNQTADDSGTVRVIEITSTGQITVKCKSTPCQ